MKNTLKIMILFTLLFTVSCTNDSESDFLPLDSNPIVEVEVDHDIVISYTNNVASIISSNCLGCHSSPTRNGAPFSLVTYNQVETRSGRILDAISLQTGEPRAMPPSGRMPQATIDIINQWIDEGLIE